ncbi:NAD-dependent epimerase/dehydratase family protein [Duganella sp. FT80W]|uniref:GDP-L-fucose synthase n=1 Tax=Duganella guangzhouensis TaxID=2666084 RepID=A0A6I2L0Z6_9BURK|nr:GDP-L-fucose synthase [Duganella guangzhouensis]MRW89949.1 NAD-dependent epimerase/dehydratase family protein [Duganella guangzhouensis]
MNQFSQRIFVAGHTGLVGSAILRALRRQGYTNLLTCSRAQLDLTDQAQVRSLFKRESIDVVYLAAATVGGIHANNSYPAEFIYSNMAIEANVIHEAWRHGTQKLLFLGSSCIYPRLAPQPIPEAALLHGALEPTNEPYAIAKIAGIKICESYNRQYGTRFRSVMPTNLYGPGDNYHAENSHVIPALIRRLHEAKHSGAGEVLIWGTGEARREFLYVDDLADACLHVMSVSEDCYRSVTKPMVSHLNIGSGEEITIAMLAQLVAQVVGYSGRLVFDLTRPDGTPRKLLDSASLGKLGWRASVTLARGLQETYHSFLRAEQAGSRQQPARALDPVSRRLRGQFQPAPSLAHAYADMRVPY